MARVLLVLAAFLSLVGCVRAGPPPGTPVDGQDAAVIDEMAGITTPEQMAKKVAELRARLAAALAQQKALEQEALAARVRLLQATSWWVAGISLLACLACVAAAVVFSVARKLLISCAAASAAVLVLAITLGYVIPYLVFVGLAVGLLGLVALVLYLFKLRSLTSESFRVGTAALAELDQRNHPVAEQIKEEAEDRQKKTGLLTVVRNEISRYKPVSSSVGA